MAAPTLPMPTTETLTDRLARPPAGATGSLTTGDADQLVELPRLTQPEPTSGRASLHRYSPGGEYDGNEYGGLPVKPCIFVRTLWHNIIPVGQLRR